MDIDETAKRISKLTTFSYQDIAYGLNESANAFAKAGCTTEEIESILTDENIINLLNGRNMLGR